MEAKDRLHTWLYGASPATYHLAEDAQDLSGRADPDTLCDFGSITNPYQKFFIYKYEEPSPDVLSLISGKGMYREIGRYSLRDPDIYSPLLQSVYQTLWPELTAQPFMRYKANGGYRIASDAMTSAMSRLSDALRISVSLTSAPDHADPGMIERIRAIYASCQKRAPKQKWWTMLMIALVTADLSETGCEEDFYRMIDREYPAMAGFLSDCFTVGNYCPVPAGFNGPRSRWGRYDYWDLTLMKIREWYCNESGPDADRIFLKEQLLNNHPGSSPDNCRAWLTWFENKGALPQKDGWHSFVDTLLLQDYVDADYNVKPFWPGHSWRNPDLPEDREAVNRGLLTISIRIASRSARIISACRSRL